ncbi:MAG TPA: 50S ribosomal protein L19 [Candidatus Fermentibacter sp.]|mgnify:CR=1 FL=1|nr:50S ribosomal protein L19 [Candidatus Fermentibacter sp.]HRY61385.1 50S ribosomal protein L19 [Candidatus Fermentibacter sp.]
MDELLRLVESRRPAEGVQDFGPGDNVKVHYQVVEGDKVRIQIFEGVVISRRGGGAGETFIVRKISNGVGVERIFPLCSPRVAAVEVVRKGKVRRAKLFFLRQKRGRAARIKEKRVY